MPRRNSLQAKIERRIAQSDAGAFLTREFRDLGGERQVLRALSKSVKDGKLIRLGYGVYGRAARSQLSGQSILATRGGFVGASREALTKLGINWEPTDWERAYNEGRSTQVPVNAVVRVRKGRFSRRINYQGNPLVIER